MELQDKELKKKLAGCKEKQTKYWSSLLFEGSGYFMVTSIFGVN